MLQVNSEELFSFLCGGTILDKTRGIEAKQLYFFFKIHLAFSIMICLGNNRSKIHCYIFIIVTIFLMDCSQHCYVVGLLTTFTYLWIEIYFILHSFGVSIFLIIYHITLSHVMPLAMRCFLGDKTCSDLICNHIFFFIYFKCRPVTFRTGFEEVLWIPLIITGYILNICSPIHPISEGFVVLLSWT